VSRYQYYEQMKLLARQQRQKYGINGPRVLRADMRRIFREEGIRVDYWDRPMKKIRGAYFNDEIGATVMILKNLPPDPCVFTMAHELKHHLADKTMGVVMCEITPASEMIEIGAEVFAAEFLFPESCFKTSMAQMGVNPLGCTAESLVRLKHETKTTLSYAGLVKLAVRLEFAAEGTLPKAGWRKIEERIYGVPFYRARRA
jgi:Zn-dependent peptidase ImmA (M78 family)